MTSMFADQNAQTIQALTVAIEKAQKLLEQLKTPQLTSEGWYTTQANGTPNTLKQKSFALRHACVWNDKEERDLVRKWLQFTSVDILAKLHKRTEGSIRSELQRLLYSSNVEILLDEICGKEVNQNEKD